MKHTHVNTIQQQIPKTPLSSPPFTSAQPHQNIPLTRYHRQKELITVSAFLETFFFSSLQIQAQSLQFLSFSSEMARFVLFFALFALPGIVLAARPARNPFELEGSVFCDTCLAGFETSKTTYIAGAKVRVECRNRETMELVYSKEATTDSTGKYKMYVSEDHQDQLCDAMVVSSPQSGCSKPASGRDKARVILTNYNGMATNKRYANAMGFEAAEPMLGCAEVLRQYQEYED